MKCERCKRYLTENEWNLRRPMPGEDYGASHYFCEDCLIWLELDPAQIPDPEEAHKCAAARPELVSYTLGVGHTQT